MFKKLFQSLLAGILLFTWNQLAAQSESQFSEYHTNKQVQQLLKKMTGNNVSLHTLAESPGGEVITILEIGTHLEDAPAIFVGANFEGNVPLATEGALYLAQMLIDSGAYTENVKWYIMPQPNPDAASGYFAPVKSGLDLNKYSVNNDADEATNEDGFEDLNGDGFITQMRVKDIEGDYVVSKSNPLIMAKADTKKGQRGVYKIYSEGIDNDADSKYNEDGEGGINVGIAFPHLFPRETSEAGIYPGQTPEVYSIMRFIYDRPEIAMVYTLGSSNFCLVPPKGGRKGGANLESIRLSGRYARMLNAESGKTYRMSEVIEMAKAVFPPGMEVTPSMIAGMLGLGAAVNPQDDDLAFYKAFSEDYKKYLAAKKFNTERLDPQPAKDGSFELWAYYHLGVPSFSMNLFTVPKAKEEKKEAEDAVSLEEVGKMSPEDFIALGNDKITAFLKTNNATGRFKTDSVVKMMESGQITPEKMVGMMKKMPKPEKEGELSEKDKALLAYSEAEWDGKGFVEWKAIDHPSLEQVEVGGYVPYLETTPKPEKIDSLAGTQLPWLLQLSKKLPEIKFESEKLTRIGEGIYKLDVFVANNGELAYPISMGERNGQPAPVIVVLDGDLEILEGKQRTTLGSIGDNKLKKLSWLIKTTGKKPIATVKIESVVFTDDVKQINIGG